jgi:capsule biosynthesis phosphatase
MKNKKKFCFDIDNTLCLTKLNFYEKSKPIKKAINVVNKLHKNGHIIILFTARGMGSFKGNIKKIKKEYETLTIAQLKKWNVQYNELIFGKPSYDYIIDDKSVFFNKKWYEKFEYFTK